MNKNRILTLCLICVSIVLLLPLAQAAGPSDTLTVWTDKSTYSAGENGKLYVTYNNVRDSPISIRSISIIFKEWWAYDKTKNTWLGNITYTPPETEKTVTEHTIRVYEITFTVPSDGRAKDTEVELKVYTNLASPDELKPKPTIYVGETPVYMQQIVTLITTQAVLIILGSVIIAITIFLSTRRPQVTWKAEEKTE